MQASSNLKKICWFLWIYFLTVCMTPAEEKTTVYSSSLSNQVEQTVQQWGVFELQLSGPDEGNPFLDVMLSAAFCNQTTLETITIPGFYDGDGIYRICFSPPLQSVWTYVTRSNRLELDAKHGSLTAVAPSGTNQGPLRVYKTFQFIYADGMPYYPVGPTCYAWIHQSEQLQEQTLKTLAESI